MRMPDPRLTQLNKLVGTWELTHRDLSTGEVWLGRDTFEWLEGGYFLAMHHEEFDRLKGMMLIGYETRWGQDQPGDELIGHWFETSTGHHYDYIWEVDDKHLTFWLERKDSGAAFTGVFNDDHTVVTGVWKWPGGGYDLTMRKVQG